MSARSAVVPRQVLPLAVACALLSSGCFLFDRPNPRLKKAVKTTGDIEETLTLSYDDDAFLKKVVIAEAIATQTLELSWQQGLIESVAIEKDPENEAFETERSVARLTWDGGRVTKAKETYEDNNPDDDLDAPVLSSTLTYADDGAFKKLEQNKSANGAAVIDVTDFVYDEGKLASIDSTLRVVVGAEETSRAITERDIELKDGAPHGITIENAGNVTQLDVELDDEGRVDAFELTFSNEEDPDNERTALVGFSYGEDGLLSAITISDDDGLSDDPLTELTYDEGEAQGVDVTPYSVFLYGLWDLTGKSHLTLEPSTQSARFVLPVW